jgi:hypothetical protein
LIKADDRAKHASSGKASRSFAAERDNIIVFIAIISLILALSQ